MESAAMFKKKDRIYSNEYKRIDKTKTERLPSERSES